MSPEGPSQIAARLIRQIVLSDDRVEKRVKSSSLDYAKAFAIEFVRVQNEEELEPQDYIQTERYRREVAALAGIDSADYDYAIDQTAAAQDH